MITINKNKYAGASLIEIVLAIAIFSIALLALVSFQAGMMRERTLINQRNEALNLAEDKMQSFRQYTVIATTPGKLAYDDITSGSDSPVYGTTTYNRTWTVTNSTNAPDRKTVQVQVSWSDIKNITQQVTLNTIIAKIEPETAGNVAKNL